MTSEASWRDYTFGSVGQWMWLAACSATILPAMFLVIAIGEPGYPTPPSNIAVAVIFFLLPTLWVMFYISQVVNVFQQLTIDKNYIYGQLYFGRRKIISLSEISSISYYPLTWKIRKINLFDPKQSGIDVRTISGKQYLINARTTAFGEIVATLKLVAMSHPQINCSL